MVGWPHLLNQHEFEKAPGVGDGQESLACCSPWSHKELDTTEQLNRTEDRLTGEKQKQKLYNMYTWERSRKTE